MKDLPPDKHAALVKRLARCIFDSLVREAEERDRAIAGAPAENDAPAAAPVGVASPARRRSTP